MIPPLSAAAAGMQAASVRLEASARRVASGEMENYAIEAVEQIGARADFSANAAVVRTADQMTGRLLDILI